MTDDRSRTELEQALSRAGEALARAEAARQLAEEALRSRDEFLRVAAHELRSPLAAVQLQTDTLALLARQGAENGEIHARASGVTRSVQRLARTLDEVVDLARASSSRLALYRTRMDLALLVPRVVDRFSEDLRRAGCEPRVSVPASPVTGEWDEQRVEHAVGVLLMAGRESGAGKPLDIDLVDEGDAARISVRDRGVGPTESACALLSERFDVALAGARPGAHTMSLWLVARIAELHGGRLALLGGQSVLRLPKTGA